MKKWNNRSERRAGEGEEGGRNGFGIVWEVVVGVREEIGGGGGGNGEESSVRN
jgi:hypothetical protein